MLVRTFGLMVVLGLGAAAAWEFSPGLRTQMNGRNSPRVGGRGGPLVQDSSQAVGASQTSDHTSPRPAARSRGHQRSELRFGECPLVPDTSRRM